MDSMLQRFIEASDQVGQDRVVEACRYYADHVLKIPLSICFMDALNEFLSEKLEKTSLENHRTLRYYIGKLGIHNLEDMNPHCIEKKIQALKMSPRSKNNCRGAWKTFLVWCKSKRYIDPSFDPLESLKPQRTKTQEIQVFTPEEMQLILDHSHPKILPLIAIGAFAGVRTAQINRLSWKDVTDSHIVIPYSVSKTRRHLVPVHPNLQSILHHFRRRSGQICPFRNVSHEFEKIVARIHNTGRDFQWIRNGLRHSYISYRVAWIKNIDQVALECGNSPQQIRQSYLQVRLPDGRVVAEDLAQKFFSLLPDTISPPS
jgi:integrase